ANSLAYGFRLLLVGPGRGFSCPTWAPPRSRHGRPVVMPGPAPKDPSTRARRNADPIRKTELRFVKGRQPKLPDRFDEEGIPRPSCRPRREAILAGSSAP